MSPDSRERLQWEMATSVYHSPMFGHRLSVDVLLRGKSWSNVHSWPWRGLGFPNELLPEIRSCLDATVTEHLLTRYGIRGELGTSWAREVGPF